MSILADQNINNDITTGSNDKWARNLGSNTRDASQPIGAGWGGYTYNPPDLAHLNRTAALSRQGPQDKGIKLVGAQEYGPEGFGRASNDVEGGNPSTVLGAFASMVGEDGAANWGNKWAARRMMETFTSGDQMRSLRDSTDASSGGARDGYSEQSQYRITNWNDANAGAHGNVQPAIPSAFDHTGIRNIAGMRSDTGGDWRTDEDRG